MGEGQHPDSSKGIRKHVSSLGALGVGTAPWIQLKESGIPLALWGGGGGGGGGGGTAPGIQLKESGIALALRGALGAGDSTRDSVKGIQNPSSTLGGSGGGRQHPGFN